ncbi:hypothetical protein DCO17_09115 [Polynucleobacter tropicus]|uniref:Glycosyltransferase 2-like domain-containing protein n=2 Tax=Polynucleobacter tropicus TaxID=1743174 RepID=A0A6M9Q7P1_9BURK|nr:hypothetical protein DCO17_09115 [Polynucleobacter tropicus]
MTPKIIFAGPVQNSAKHLPAVFQNIENMSHLASETAYVFVENDSTDSTKIDIQNFGLNKPNFTFISLDGLNQIPVRTLRLEMVRNAYLEFIKSDPKLRGFDFLVVLDMDEGNTHQVPILAFSDALAFLSELDSRAAVFANQQGSYFDMWALRSKDLCPCDAWQEVFDYAHENRVSDEQAFAQTFAKRVLSIETNKPPIKVDSAFGGLGIYKLKFVLENLNPYLGSKIKILKNDQGGMNVLRTQICEHVHFHEGLISQKGDLFIFPSLVNGVLAEIPFNPSFYRSLIF